MLTTVMPLSTLRPSAWPRTPAASMLDTDVRLYDAHRVARPVHAHGHAVIHHRRSGELVAADGRAVAVYSTGLGGLRAVDAGVASGRIAHPVDDVGDGVVVHRPDHLGVGP